MHKIALLTLTLFVLLFNGCEEKKSEESALPIENTTQEILNKKEKEAKEVLITDNVNTLPGDPKEEVATVLTPKTHFTLFDSYDQKVQVNIEERNLIFDTVEKPIILLQLFSTWCAPCIGEIKYLNNLHTLYEADLHIAALLTRDSIDKSTLDAFKDTHDIKYTLLQSVQNEDVAKEIAMKLGYPELFPIPLLILYINGKYYTHYEGSVPVEMIKYDISQAQKKLQNN